MWINKIKTCVLNLAKHLQKCIDDQLEDAALNQLAQMPLTQKKTIIGEDEVKPWVDDFIKTFKL